MIDLMKVLQGSLEAARSGRAGKETADGRKVKAAGPRKAAARSSAGKSASAKMPVRKAPPRKAGAVRARTGGAGGRRRASGTTASARARCSNGSASPRTGLGRPRCRSDQVIADKAYSSRGFRAY
ncbi:hypothetical protein ABZ299_27715 [Streptomyces sp. NPDC006184]|uniref:hypothetical protein n=1 Tax=Streptomyces sp. NPDC006184 TaxID=3155455 RepID=UPI0033BDEBB4